VEILPLAFRQNGEHSPVVDAPNGFLVEETEPVPSEVVDQLPLRLSSRPASIMRVLIMLNSINVFLQFIRNI
jgi:hypothetical protein